MNYEQIYEYILYSNKISSKNKVKFLRMLEIIESYSSKKDLKEAEDEIYTIDGKVLSENERIGLEVKNLIFKAENCSDINEKNTKLSKYYKFVKDLDEDSSSSVKEEIVEEQISNNIMPNFLTAYSDFFKKNINSLEKFNDIDKDNRKLF